MKQKITEQTKHIPTQIKENPQKSFTSWQEKNKHYHKWIKRFYQHIVPKNMRVLQLDCKNGYLLDAVKPSIGIGVDVSEHDIDEAQKTYAQYQFYCGDSSALQVDHQFDYIMLPTSTMTAYDIQTLFEDLKPWCHPQTRIVIDHYAWFWEPVLKLAQRFGFKRPTRYINWVSHDDVKHCASLAGFEMVTEGRFLLMPINIPVLSEWCNYVLAHLPLLNRLCLMQWVVLRPKQVAITKDVVSVSVIVPTRNEKGNIERAVTSCPMMGRETELIFVEGNSHDGTYEEIERVAKAYPDKNIRYCKQEGKGKGDAVRKGFDMAHGEIVMILDGDLTMPPEELPKFFDALIAGHGDFINGSRLVYGMESEAMRFLNFLANHFFSLLFSWILGQRVKDTLCGTKVLWKRDYDRIVANRSYFGDFDPFGDFDLLFGAAKLNLKIVDMPVHYKNRTYGSTQIRRFYHGCILLWMSAIGVRKFKWW